MLTSSAAAAVATEPAAVQIKLILVGQCGIGKSTLAHRIAFNKHKACEATIGSAYLTCALGQRYALNIWDTAGAEKYRSIMPMYVRNANIILCVYDVTDAESLQRVIEDRETYIDTIPSVADALWVLVGNKIDEEAVVSHEAAQRVANSWRIMVGNNGGPPVKASERGPRFAVAQSGRLSDPIGHFRISASTGQNVDALLQYLVDTLDKVHFPHHQVDLASTTTTTTTDKDIIRLWQANVNMDVEYDDDDEEKMYSGGSMMRWKEAAVEKFRHAPSSSCCIIT